MVDESLTVKIMKTSLTPYMVLDPGNDKKKEPDSPAAKSPRRREGDPEEA